MSAIDFSKGFDFSPLTKLGIPKTDAVSFLTALSPVINMEFQGRIKKAFTDEEMIAIGDEAEKKGIKAEDGMFLVEEKYHAKTGNYFMEEMRLIFNEYIVRSAEVIAKAKSDTEKFAATGGENLKKFNELMQEKKWEDAAKLLDDNLKQTP